MRKRFIFLSLSLSLVAGSVAGLSATKLANRQATEQIITYVDDNTPTHFASYPGLPAQGMLPDLTEAAEKGVQSVVNIVNKRKIRVSNRSYDSFDPFEFFFGPQQGDGKEQESKSGGSGVIISSDGYIVTNNHVIDKADEIIVTLHDQSSYTATLVGTDPSTDIALLKIEAQNLPVLQFGNSDDLRLGEWVLAIGNPYTLNSTVTAGIVSAKGRNLNVLPNSMGIESFIQTDAAVNPGNSGGALVTTDGKLVGINTLIKSPTGSFTGYSFAVPSSIVRKVVTDLKEYGIVQRALLGITFNEINQAWIEEIGKEKGITEPGGAYVNEAVTDGAAAAAGIKSGDVITHIDGKPIKSSAQVQESIAKLRPNDKVKITIKRDGEVKHFDVTLRNRAGKTDLVSKDDSDLLKELGATFREINDKQKKELNLKHGLQVIEIQPDGILASARIRRGFIITAINDKPVASVSDLNKITEKVQSIEGTYPDGGGRTVIYQIVSR